MRTSTEQDMYTKPKGQIYLTVGGAGAELYPIDPTINWWISSTYSSPPKPEPYDDYYLSKLDDSHYGFLELQFSKERRVLLGTFYGNDVLNKGSIVLDQFSILK